MSTSASTELLPVPLEAKIFVAGHGGLVGSAILRKLAQAGYRNVVTATRSEVDLRMQAEVTSWFERNRPDYVYLVAGTVGGVYANSTRPAEFLYDNLMIHGTVIEAARQCNVTKLLYLGSSCIYPRHAAQPIAEGALLSGPLEPTNEGYALAKIAGIKLCDAYRRQYGCDFISAMPTNLYGPGDNFDLDASHVIPALIRKFHEAKVAGQPEVTIWGTGSAMREFLHVDDLAAACLFLMDSYSQIGHINVGTGEDLSIRSLAETVREIVYPNAQLVFDTTKPDGMPRKVLDVGALHEAGFKHKIEFLDGLRSTYAWFEENQETARGIS